MSRLRDNTGVVLWILVFAFGVIWVLQDSGGLDAVGSGAVQGENIIVVDGDPVRYQDYVNAVEGQVQRYQTQTGQDIPPQLRDQVREQVYDALVADRLRAQQMERLGVTVTDEEVADMVLGENPHPIIRTYFADSTGTVNRQLLLNYINNPQARQDWIQMEQFLRQQRQQEKLNTLIAATVHVSEQDVRDAYRRRNLSVDARYVALPYAAVPDDSITVSEADLERYYDEHRDEYRRERTYRLAYTALPKTATAEDTAAVVRELERLRSAFATAENDSLFLAQNASERAYTSAYFTPDELDAAIADSVFPDPQPGQVLGPIYTDGMAHLVKITDVASAEETYARARHILFQGDDEEAVLQEIEQVQEALQEGADFAALARQHSDGPAGARGGALGWFGPGRMAEPFEEAAFGAEVGAVVGPVETQFGHHLIQVTGRADEQVLLADYALNLRPSVATLSDTETRLGDLAYYASESGDFREEAQTQGLDVQEVQVEAGQQTIPGIGNSRAVMRFLEDAEEDAISEVIELNDRFIVVQLEAVTPEGYRPFEEVEAQIRPQVVREKKLAVQRERMEHALAEHGFDGLADALGTTVRTQEDVSFDTRTIPGLGNDRTFVGTALGLDEGQTSRVVTGENAVFVLQVTGIDEPEPITGSEREELRAELFEQRRAELQSQWIASLREEAEIEDYRARFEQ